MDLHVYDLEEKEFIFSRAGPSEFVWGTFIDEVGNIYCSANNSNFSIWTPDGKYISHVGTHKSKVWCIYRFKNIIASGSEDVYLWDANTFKCIVKLQVGHIVSSVYLDDDKIVCGTYGDTVIVWDVRDFTKKNNFTRTSEYRAMYWCCRKFRCQCFQRLHDENLELDNKSVYPHPLNSQEGNLWSCL